MGERIINPLFNVQDKYKDMIFINPYKFGSGGGTTLKTGLVSVWELDETTGTTAYDSFGSNDGTNTGATVNQSEAPTNLGTSYYFTDETDFVDLGDISAAPFDGSSTEISGCCWVYLGSLALNQFFLQKFTNVTATKDRTFYFAVLTTGAVRVFYGDDSYFYHYYDTTTGLVSTGSWYHLAFYTDMTAGTSTIWVNGTSYSGSLGSSGTRRTTVYNGAETLKICRHQNSDSSYKGIETGYVDQVAIWNRELSSGEVSTLYNSGNGLAYINW